MKLFKKFSLFIANRGLSGIVNGLFYAGKRLWFPALILLTLFTGFQLITNLIGHWPEMSKLQRILSVLGVIGSLVSSVLVGFSFTKGLDIHLWTFMNQTSIASTYMITERKGKWWKNWWWLLLAVSPAAFLQKFFINKIPGLKWNYAGTDDATGKTWGMNLFGKRIKIPRLGNMKVKLIIAIVCIGTFFLVNHLKTKQTKLGHKIERICA